ncbi:MAG: nitroreductase [Oscillospiraceae bacterium]|nr:nitroreductase [Oscillospiraceae bacterium]
MSSNLTTIETIKTRYSCRAFTSKMPSDSDLQEIAQAALASPSAMNLQPWRVIIMKSKELLAELEAEGMKNIAALPDKGTHERIMSRGGKLYYNTPCQFIIPIPKDSKWAKLDCGIITQTIALAAASLGINSLICGLIEFAFSGDKGQYFREKIGVNDDEEIGISVLLGYADESGVKLPHELDLGKICVVE